MFKNKYFEIIDRFINDYDSISRNNANNIRSLPFMEVAVMGEVAKDYLFDVIYQGLPVRIHHDEGWSYHHQTYKLSAYCIGLSAESIAHFGLQSNAKNERRAHPPKRLDTLFMQCANLICLIAQEVSGATSLNDLSTIAGAYLWYEETQEGRKYSVKDLINLWQSFLYNINLPFRSGNSPFSNITLDFGKPADRLKDHPVVIAGREVRPGITYSDIPGEYFDRINEAFIYAMDAGDADGRPFTFPLITVNVDEEFDWDNPIFNLLLEKSEKFGGFYVQNYYQEPFERDTTYKRLNPYLRPFDKGMIYSNCCRMTFDISTVEAVTGSNPFHSGAGVGGVGVYAINLNRLLFLAKNNFELLVEMLDYLMEVGAQALQRKRAWLEEHWTDLYPYLSFYQPHLHSLYNIFSIVGVHEGMVNAGFKGGLFNDDAKLYAHKIAQHIHSRLMEFMKRDKVLYNLEYAPSENAACRMAKQDLQFAKLVANYIDGKTESLSSDPQLNTMAQECAKVNLDRIFDIPMEE